MLLLGLQSLSSPSYVSGKHDAYQLVPCLSQLGCGTHRRLLSAVCCTAGAGGRKRDPRPSTAGEEDETTEEEHAAGEGETQRSKCDLYVLLVSDR